ncbi:hypothetical protein NDU88_003250 [Pleurodeles waltl]|uniref:Uncharacterized protein n=1 Tax=Pleurodeles waltl TaxID=8319 RepID=A0AAV7T4Q2_PLEWA|nr:hypothetical protein NDU88_003250 [Pleurodeles waltl]
MGRTKGKHLDSEGASMTENCVPATAMDPPLDKLDVILKEIRESPLAIEQRLGSITTELGILKDDERKLADRVKQTVTDIVTLLPSQKDSVNAIQQLQNQVETLQERVEDPQQHPYNWPSEGYGGTRCHTLCGYLAENYTDHGIIGSFHVRESAPIPRQETPARGAGPIHCCPRVKLQGS